MDRPDLRVPDRRHVETPARRTRGGTAWREFGAGEPLVLLHGGAGSWLHWVRNVDALAERFRVIAVDCPAYGDSEPVPEDITDEGYLELLRGEIGEMIGDAPRVHFAGFSFGGYIAPQMAVRFGARSASLSMTGGAGYGPPEGRPFTLDSKRRLARRLGRQPTADELCAMDRDNLAKLMLWDEAAIDDWAVDMQRRNVERTRFDSRRLSWCEGTPELIGRLSCPVMVVYGEHDAAAIPPPAERFERCRAARPDVVTRLIPECGHWAMYETPEVMNRLMLDFHSRA
ncbi:MAG TPA: alpha/beta hydrolase [Paracoccaceae bacterium]|nr:alpha/beta hydrolase [Paracoccaceae bacterium]